MRKVIIQHWHDFPLAIVEINNDAKMCEGRRLSTIYVCDYKPGLDTAINRHNEYIEQSKKFLQLAQELRSSIRP